MSVRSDRSGRGLGRSSIQKLSFPTAELLLLTLVTPLIVAVNHAKLPFLFPAMFTLLNAAVPLAPIAVVVPPITSLPAGVKLKVTVNETMVPAVRFP
jgi:hypothetical protein